MASMGYASYNILLLYVMCFEDFHLQMQACLGNMTNLLHMKCTSLIRETSHDYYVYVNHLFAASLFLQIK